MARKADGKPTPYKRGGVQVTRDGQPGWRLRAFDARTGRQPERNFYGTFEAACLEQERFRAELDAAAQPAPANSRNMRVSTWMVQWLQLYAWKVRPVGKNPGVRRPQGSWRNAKANVSAYIGPGLGHRTLASLTYDDCYEFVAGLRVKGGKQEAAASTKDKVASVLRLMLADAHRAGITKTDVAADLPTSWGARRKVVIPSLRQVSDLAEELDDQWPGRGDIVRALAFTGLRWEELAALRWDDIDWDRRSVHVWQARPSGATTAQGLGAPKTLASDRYAALLDQAVDPLRRLQKFAEDRGATWVLVGERGAPLSYGLWRKHLDRAREATGVPYTAHQLRHVAVSLMIAGGATPLEVRDQVGHSRSSVTERVYRHAWSMDRSELAARLSAAVTSVEVDESAES